MTDPRPRDNDPEDDDFVPARALVAEVVEAIDAGDAAGLNALLEPVHGADIADLIEQLPPHRRREFIRLYSGEIDAEILTEIDESIRVKDLTDDQVTQLRDYIEGNLKVEGDLRREVQADIRRKIEIGCYQGLRHRRGLPVRGQRTKTNARTRKGPKRTVAGKKKAR